MPLEKKCNKLSEIKSNKLLLVEGADAYFFFIWALQAFGVEGIQVMDFGGIQDLTVYLKTLSGLSNYENVTNIVIARDAELNPDSAIKNVKNSFKQVLLPIPPNPFEFTGANPRTAFMIFPGLKIRLYNPERWKIYV